MEDSDKGVMSTGKVEREAIEFVEKTWTEKYEPLGVWNC
jgi:hypothetical protein